MKRHFILMLIAALLTSGTMMAQQHRRGNGPRDFDPKERAERMTERMAKEYKLTDEQKQQLLEVNTKQAKSQKAEMEKKREAKKKDFEKMKAEREAYDAELKKILTKEQYEAYQKDAKKRGPQGRHPGRRGGPRGGKGPHQ